MKRRGTRGIEISPELARGLASLRESAGVDSEPEVNLDRLQDVEAALAVSFQDDVLALFAASIPELGARLDAVIATTAEIRARQPRGDWIGLGHLDGDSILCIRKGRQQSSDTDVVVVCPHSGAATSLKILEFVNARIRPSTMKDVEFAPRLHRPVPESTMHGSRVSHAKFGEGRLLSSQGQGPTRRCKVDFPSVGLKTIQARFLRFADGLGGESG